MNQRKLQAVINRINDDVNYYKKEIRYLNKNAEYYNEQYVVFEKVTNFEGRIDEAHRILKQLEMLKESIK
tara:strand:+ start:112 stop:321 length:210 start_codon:yes stop_codon:yes gene_type:complete